MGKIEGDRIKKGETYRHPTCRSSPPPAVLKPKPPMSTGAKSRARVPTAGSTVRIPTAGSNLTPVKAPPRTPCRKSRECPRMVVSEVTSTKRADRMVAKYGVGKHEVSGVSVGSGRVGKSVGVNARCAPMAATKRATQAKKASFTSAASSLNSMAFGYGDLTAASLQSRAPGFLLWLDKAQYVQRGAASGPRRQMRLRRALAGSSELPGLLSSCSLTSSIVAKPARRGG